MAQHRHPALESPYYSQPREFAVSEELKHTIKIVKQSNTEPVEFELVSTVMLQKILKSDDEKAKRSVEKAAKSGDGALALNTDNDSYEIVDAAGNEEFSLVSTQMLRRVLDKNKPKVAKPVEPVALESGFDPYNSD